MERIFLGVNSKGQLQAEAGPPLKAGIFHIIKSREDMKRMLDKYPNIETIVTSSSIDHPEEYTRDRNVIDLCKWIRTA